MLYWCKDTIFARVRLIFIRKRSVSKELTRVFNKNIFLQTVRRRYWISIYEFLSRKMRFIILLHVSNERSGLRVTIQSKSFPLRREIFGSVVLTGWMVLRTILYRASDWCFHIPHWDASSMMLEKNEETYNSKLFVDINSDIEESTIEYQWQDNQCLAVNGGSTYCSFVLFPINMSRH